MNDIRINQGRVAYRPEWSLTLPYVTYWKGTAGRHFATLQEAIDHVKAKK